MAHHELVNHWRKQGRLPSALAEEAASELATTYIAAPEHEQRTTDLQDCLSGLGAEFASVIRRYLLGESHEQIAEKLDIPVNTSYTRFSRAKPKLKECMERKGWTE